ncbi:MAG TPA: PPC domain-containing protein, partial [Pirellulales bacterium]|nr:PPC domain-containing protein [Pirellulales bacterium]
RVFPAGGQQGATFELQASGSHFDEVDRLHFSDPGITAAFVAGGGEEAVEGEKHQRSEKFRVSIAASVRPGIYDVRAVSPQGVSNPRAFVVGTRPELVEVEPNGALGQATEVPVPAVVNGRLEQPADVDFFRFAAKAGERLILDCAAYRIDSRLDAVLVVYNAAGEEIERSHDFARRDPLLDFVAPADGQYVVAVHDLTYAGSRRHVYRLSIGTAPYIDFVFPPSGLAGSEGRFHLFGRNLPGGQLTDLRSIDGRPLETLEVPIALPADLAAQQTVAGSIVEPVEIILDGAEFQLDAPAGPSNPVFISRATAPVVVEQDSNDDPAHAQMLTLPCECVGQFFPRGDRDFYTFHARKGDVYWIELFGQRLGLPSDPLLLVQQVTKNEAGQETVADVAAIDDEGAGAAGDLFYTASDDPTYQFVAPADGTYRLMVTDLAGTERSDPRFVYRLSIRTPQPDFRLVAVPRCPPNNPEIGKVQPNVWNPAPHRGGADLVEIIAQRRDGFDGEIVVSAAGLPAGVTAPPITIGPGQATGTLVLSAAEDAPDATAGVGTLSITGTAKIGDAELRRTARPATMVSAGIPNVVTPRSRAARDLVVGVAGGDKSPLAVAVADTARLEMARPGLVKFTVNVIRRGDFKGPVTLVPLSVPPAATAKDAVVVEPDKTSAELEMKLNKNTPLGTYSFLVVGIADVPAARFGKGRGGNVKIGIPSPPLDIAVTASPIRLAVDVPAEPAPQGSKVELAIKLERLYDYNDPVQVRVSIPGELEGVRAAVINIPRGQSEGKLAITLAENATLGVHKLTLNAIARLGGQELPNTREFQLTVAPAAPTPAPQSETP